jgi:hypothetical protein
VSQSLGFFPEEVDHMAEPEPTIRRTLSEAAARQLANATKTRAQWSGITPRWLVTFMPWIPIEAGIYRLNRVKEAVALTDTDVECSPRRDTDTDLPETFVGYEGGAAGILAQRGRRASRTSIAIPTIKSRSSCAF